MRLATVFFRAAAPALLSFHTMACGRVGLTVPLAAEPVGDFDGGGSDGWICLKDAVDVTGNVNPAVVRGSPEGHADHYGAVASRGTWGIGTPDELFTFFFPSRALPRDGFGMPRRGLRHRAGAPRRLRRTGIPRGLRRRWLREAVRPHRRPKRRSLVLDGRTAGEWGTVR